MGYYIETGMSRNKALSLVTEHNGQIIDQPASFAEIPADKALIIIVDNRMFEAAALAFSEAEFKEFTSPYDGRPKQYVLLDKKLAHELSGYRER